MSFYSPFTITIPANGVSETFQATGRSFIVLRSSVYETGQYPKFNFGSELNSDAVELFPQSTYNNNGNKFNQITIAGTSQSAGETIELLITNECLDTQINFSVLDVPRVTAGTSLEKAMAGDGVLTLSELELFNANNNLPRKIYISCRGGNVVYNFNIDPEQSASGSAEFGTVLTEETDPVEIVGLSFILALRFRPAVSTETPILTIHIEY